MKLLSDSRRLRKFIIWLEGLRMLEAASQAARGGRRGATGAGPRLASPADSRGALGLGCQAANKREVGGAEGVATSVPAPRRRVCSAPAYARAQPSSSSIGRGGEPGLPPPERDCVGTRRPRQVEGWEAESPHHHHHHLRGLERRVVSQLEEKTPSSRPQGRREVLAFLP